MHTTILTTTEPDTGAASPVRPARGRWLATALMALLLVASFLVAGQTDAGAADEPDVDFHRPILARSCSDDYIAYPTGIKLVEDPTRQLWNCVGKHWTRITTLEICTFYAEYRGFSRVPWDEETSTCVVSTTGGTTRPCLPPYAARPWILTSTGDVINTCLIPLYYSGTFFAPAPADAMQPICIEDPRVLGNEALQSLSPGSTFTGSDGLEYLIHTGAPTCQFNCAGGFDANCDGTFGDYCSSEIDTSTVGGVKACIESLAEAQTIAEDLAEEVAAADITSVGGAS